MPKKTWLFQKKRIYKYILKLIELCLAFSVANAKSKTGFFHLKRVENNDRSQIGEEPLSSLMEMATDESHMQNTTTRKLRKFLYNKKIGRKLTMNKNDLAFRIKKIKQLSECTKNISTSS